jgi:hypothetical protein
MPMLAVTMSTTERNDLALLGIVLLACGIGALAVQGAALAERLVLAGGLWSAALATCAAARRP